MQLSFDISQDELPIFIAETEDHLLILEEGLVRLEQADSDPELLQAMFRAAHTLKGMAGMIGHKRLVDLTHVLETAFDGVRKQTLAITTPLIDLCLQSLDALRVLRDEVINDQPSLIDIDEVVARFGGFIDTARLIGKSQSPPPPAVDLPIPVDAAIPGEQVGTPDGIYTVTAEIAPDSVASAARAFQLMLALQSTGEILAMDPTQEQIESSAPVARFSARFRPTQPVEAVEKELASISDVAWFTIQAEGSPTLPAPAPVLPAVDPADEINALHLGEYLVKTGSVTQAQLDEALRIQKTTKTDLPSMVGQILKQMGVINPETLDRRIGELMSQQRAAIQSLQQSEQERSLREKVIADKTVRTSVERLDVLMDLVGELITDRNRLNQIRRSLETSFRGDEQVAALVDTVVHLGRITDQLQEEVMHIRMLPVSNVFNKFPRMIRDLAQRSGKEVELVIHGQETEMDRSVIELINDPLIHLLRNAIDHGIEMPEARIAAGKPARGTIRLSARHEHGHIVLTVEDDGHGIDVERLKASAVSKKLISENEAASLTPEKAINLIFLSGLSTAAKVTEVSGRGVGMDIVRNNIEGLNGSITVESLRGSGAKFEVSLPLTLAIVPTLLVRICEITFAIPLATVTETLRLSKQAIKTIRGKPVTLLRDQILTLVDMGEAFALRDGPVETGYTLVVVVGTSKCQVGLMVDELLGEQEVVVKSFNELIGDVPGVSSAAILGDGKVALIVDVQGLFKLIGLN